MENVRQWVLNTLLGTVAKLWLSFGSLHSRWISRVFPTQWQLKLIDLTDGRQNSSEPGDGLDLESDEDVSCPSLPTTKDTTTATRIMNNGDGEDRFHMKDNLAGLDRVSEGRYTKPFYFVQCADTQVGISSAFPWLRRPKSTSRSPPSLASPRPSKAGTTAKKPGRREESPTPAKETATEEDIQDAMAWEWDLINMEKLVYSVNAMRPAPRFLCVCGDLGHFLPETSTTRRSLKQKVYTDSRKNRMALRHFKVRVFYACFVTDRFLSFHSSISTAILWP